MDSTGIQPGRLIYTGILYSIHRHVQLFTISQYTVIGYSDSGPIYMASVRYAQCNLPSANLGFWWLLRQSLGQIKYQYITVNCWPEVSLTHTMVEAETLCQILCLISLHQICSSKEHLWWSTGITKSRHSHMIYYTLYEIKLTSHKTLLTSLHAQSFKEFSQGVLPDLRG